MKTCRKISWAPSWSLVIKTLYWTQCQLWLYHVGSLVLLCLIIWSPSLMENRKRYWLIPSTQQWNHYLDRSNVYLHVALGQSIFRWVGLSFTIMTIIQNIAIRWSWYHLIFITEVLHWEIHVFIATAPFMLSLSLVKSKPNGDVVVMPYSVMDLNQR